MTMLFCIAESEIKVIYIHTPGPLLLLARDTGLIRPTSPAVKHLFWP